jgi:hypothetical protein
MTINSKKWYKEARKQTFETLPEFIKKVEKAFPGYVKDEPPTDKQYTNGIWVGILITFAAFHATSNTYRYSCNQAGAVRVCFYGAVFDKYTNYEQL